MKRFKGLQRASYSASDYRWLRNATRSGAAVMETGLKRLSVCNSLLHQQCNYYGVANMQN